MYTDTNQKKARVAILTLEKLDFRAMNNDNDKRLLYKDNKLIA